MRHKGVVENNKYRGTFIAAPLFNAYERGEITPELLLLLMQIRSLSKRPAGCTASNPWLVEHTGLKEGGERCIQSRIKWLAANGYIKREWVPNHGRKLTVTAKTLKEDDEYRSKEQDEREYNGTFVPAEIFTAYERGELAPRLLMLLMQIRSLSAKKPCWASNKWLAIHNGMDCSTDLKQASSERRIRNWITELVDLKLIFRATGLRGRRMWVSTTASGPPVDDNDIDDTRSARITLPPKCDEPIRTMDGVEDEAPKRAETSELPIRRAETNVAWEDGILGKKRVAIPYTNPSDYSILGDVADATAPPVEAFGSQPKRAIPPDAINMKRARRLVAAVRAAGPNITKPSQQVRLSLWAGQFARAAAMYGDERVDKALAWLTGHLEHPRAPHAWCGASFRVKFIAIETCARIDAEQNPTATAAPAAPELVLSPKLTAIHANVSKARRWPARAVQEMPAAMAKAWELVKVYRAKLAGREGEKGYFWRFAAHLEKLLTPHWFEAWWLQVGKDYANWAEWQGSLSGCGLDGERFERWLIDVATCYCARPAIGTEMYKWLKGAA